MDFYITLADDYLDMINQSQNLQEIVNVLDRIILFCNYTDFEEEILINLDYYNKYIDTINFKQPRINFINVYCNYKYTRSSYEFNKFYLESREDNQFVFFKFLSIMFLKSENKEESIKSLYDILENTVYDNNKESFYKDLKYSIDNYIINYVDDNIKKMFRIIDMEYKLKRK